MTKHLEALTAKGISSGTIREKKLVFKALLNRPGVKPVMPAGEVPHDVVRQLLDSMAENKSGHRANTYRKHLMRLWNWGKRARLVEGECPWDVEKYKEERRERYVPPEEDFWKVYEISDQLPSSHFRTSGHAFEAPHRKRMLLAFMHTAARRGELFRLKWEDVDFERERLRLWTRKRDGGLEFDWIPMTQKLYAALKEQRLETGFRSYVFINPVTDRPYVNANKMMKRLCERAGVKPFGFHAIRHLSASVLLRSHVDLATVQLILRHRSVTTTARYAHSLADSAEALNKAFGSKVVDMKKASSGN